jgi:hypothetical protein
MAVSERLLGSIPGPERWVFGVWSGFLQWAGEQRDRDIEALTRRAVPTGGK